MFNKILWLGLILIGLLGCGPNFFNEPCNHDDDCLAAVCVNNICQEVDGEYDEYIINNVDERLIDPMRFVKINAGRFFMVSPIDEPGKYNNELQHEVIISQDFYMQEVEVTRGLWKEVMGGNPSRTPPHIAWEDNCPLCPIAWVEWEEAILFANRLSEREGLEVCYKNNKGEKYNERHQ